MIFETFAYCPKPIPGAALPSTVGVVPFNVIGPLMARMSVKFRSIPLLLDEVLLAPKPVRLTPPPVPVANTRKP